MKTKKTIAKFLFSLSLGCVSLIGTACAAEKVVIGFDPTYAPFEYKNSDGTYGGFDYAVGNELCKRMKIECTWKEINFDGSIPALKARKIDAILSAMSITEERSKQVDGRLDATLTNAATAAEGFLKLPQGKSFMISQPVVSDTKFFGKGVGIAFRKNDLPLQKAFDAAIAGIKQDGTLSKISTNYFNFAIQ